MRSETVWAFVIGVAAGWLVMPYLVSTVRQVTGK